jgi:guanine deaminase
MEGVAALHAANPSTWIQTHLAETADETAWVRRLFPGPRSYLEVYARCGLLGPRSVFAHGLRIDDRDREALRAAGAAIAVCPTSNLFLGSGMFDFEAASRAGVRWGFGSDVGAGTSLSPFRTMLEAFQIARLAGVSLGPGELWRRHTIDAARVLGLGTCVGNLAPGFEPDFIALDPLATPLLARRTCAASSLDDWLFALIVLGDDRAVRHVVIDGAETPSC